MKTVSKASRQRSMLTARNINKVVKRGEQIFLAVVRRIGDGVCEKEKERKEKKDKKKRVGGKVNAVSIGKKTEVGPKKDFISAEQRREEILQRVDQEHRE